MYSCAAPKPDHVPKDLVYDLDIYNDAELRANPYDRIKDIAENAPTVFWTPTNKGHWVVTSYNLIRIMSNLPEVFSNSYEDQSKVLEELVNEGPERVPIPVPIMLDPPYTFVISSTPAESIFAKKYIFA